MALQPQKELSAMISGKHWLGAPRAESIFIMAPPLLSVLVVLLFHDYFTSHELSTFWWVLLVLSIDVSHVYSTLFRMYWDKETFRQNRKLLVTIPLFSLSSPNVVDEHPFRARLDSCTEWVASNTTG